MPTDNRTLLQKADLDTAGLTAGGLLQPQQTDQFFRLMVKKAVLLSRITATPMRGPKERRDKTRFGGRVLKPGNENQALALAQRSTPDLSYIELDAKLIKAECRISDEVLEDQIERGAFQRTILETLAAAVARDLDFLISQGDTTSSDPLLAVLDGFIKQAVTNVVPEGGPIALAKGTFFKMLKAMPDEFVSPSAIFLTNRQAKLAYRDSLISAATPNLGELALATAGEINYNGYPIVDVPEFPNNLGGGTNETRVLFTEPQNMLLGMLRDVRVKQAEDISAGQVIMVVTMRVDAKYLHEPAVVKATGILGT